MDALGSVPGLIWIWVIKEDLIFVGAPSLVGKEVIYPLLLR